MKLSLPDICWIPVCRSQEHKTDSRCHTKLEMSTEHFLIHQIYSLVLQEYFSVDSVGLFEVHQFIPGIVDTSQE